MDTELSNQSVAAQTLLLTMVLCIEMNEFIDLKVEKLMKNYQNDLSVPNSWLSLTGRSCQASFNVKLMSLILTKSRKQTKDFLAIYIDSNK